MYQRAWQPTREEHADDRPMAGKAVDGAHQKQHFLVAELVDELLVQRCLPVFAVMHVPVQGAGFPVA